MTVKKKVRTIAPERFSNPVEGGLTIDTAEPLGPGAYTLKQAVAKEERRYFSVSTQKGEHAIIRSNIQEYKTGLQKGKAQLDAYWQPRKVGAKNFLFIKQNARYPHKLSDIQADGDSGSAMVSFTPDPGSLAAAAPMYFATRARYALKKHQGKWKLTGFEAIKQKQQRAVKASASAQDMLSRHLEIMASIYPPRRQRAA